MKRKTDSEKVAKFRYRHVKAESDPLKARIEEWARYNVDAVAQGIEANPVLPDALSDRASDGWEPLVVIADLADGRWSDRARYAATTLMKAEDDGSRGVLLLRDIHEVIKTKGNPVNIASADLLNALKGTIEESQWEEFDWTQTRIAHELKKYQIRPRTIRVGSNTLRGYRRIDFVDAWRRYAPDLTATVQHEDSELKSVAKDASEISDVAVNGSPEKGQFELDVADVADDDDIWRVH